VRSCLRKFLAKAWVRGKVERVDTKSFLQMVRQRIFPGNGPDRGDYSSLV